MEYRFLGQTGLRVSALSLGSMTFGGSGSPFFEGVGGVDQKTANQMIDICLDRGINLVDTADVYSRGISEEMIGKALRSKRDKMLVATKCHGRMSDEVNDLGQSRHHIVNSCDASLRRLGTDYIDIYQVHGYDAYTSLSETLGALTDLVRQGKVRYIGCSNLSAWQLMKALSVSERANLSRFACLQANYSLVAREAEYELLPLCEDQRLGFVVWSPLAGGYLTGKYHSQAGTSHHGRRSAVGDPGSIDEERGQSILATMTDIAAQHNASVSQVALNYLLARADVTSVLVGARTIDQLIDNFACIEWSLGPGELDALDTVSATPSPYPYWHQRKYNRARFRVST
ncbi:MAG TPA: aldo/keto reductase [Chloroflexi bacterium]|nr:aldo/keto reductase [Chloroflexota bacterium]